MRLICSVIALLWVPMIFAQDIRPASLVEAAQSYTRTASVGELFTKNSSRSSGAETAGIEYYQRLNLNPESLSEVREAAPDYLELNLPGIRSNFDLQLVQVNPLAGNFQVSLASGTAPPEAEGLHYRGIIRNQPGSVVALSFFNDEVMGLISPAGEDNLVLGKQTNGRDAADYILYRDASLMLSQEFDCATPDGEGSDYTEAELFDHPVSRAPGDCVEIYFEVDHDIYQNKGGATNTTNYITGLFNQVSTLYANDNISVVLSEIYLWDTTSPYNGSSSSQMLNQFQSHRTSFNGNIAQLLSYQASGGIAVLNGLCHPYLPARMSFASISSIYNTVPTYSWSVMVVAHELGHQLGSQHTHACVWNGNNTAIDGCAGSVEGNCANPGYPSNGGTIMSYCHITPIGIDLSLGFGPQPGNVIRSRIASASCTSACSTGGGGGPGNGSGGNGSGSGSGSNDCDLTTVFLEIVLDDYAMETSWSLKNNAGQTVYSFGPYEKLDRNETVRDTFCLSDGCYTFTIEDEHGDGICCTHANGEYTISLMDGTELASGGAFASTESVSICVNDDNDNGGGCPAIDFNDYVVTPYGGNQNAGTATILDAGNVILLEGNSWHDIAFDYDITPNTIIEFEFRSTNQGEIHGIGLDNDENISYGRTFKVHGTQNWGQSAFDNYPNDSQWKAYTIPVGQYYTGFANRLFFVGDHDAPPYNANSYFRAVRVYEDGDCGQSLLAPATTQDVKTWDVFPNPATDKVQLTLPVSEEETMLQVFNAQGQRVHAEVFPAGVYTPQTLDVSTIVNGSYLIQLTQGEEMVTEKLVIQRD